MFNTTQLPEGEIYDILANSRRRETLRLLTNAESESIELGALATAISASETGHSPPPRTARDSVRSSLHQTHLPKLHELGVVNYDTTTHTVTLCTHARDVERYMGVLTPYGVTWSEVYRSLGIVSLLIVLGTLLEAPLVSLIDPLLWTSSFLAAFAVVISAQLWSNRWSLVRSLRR
ncbi:hypothetical protein OB919_16790 [Halobacteria archaeon AArc-curdl1]|uniref:DUF7344 domain-containing protein n=1 Tax=Natronosalvus hydrolyticus TaxID=2979988 RepID=A0AAP2ZB20_9EURY|nr:hypothetical protein [Halobacteria archaeon AArc-curdl1]